MVKAEEKMGKKIINKRSKGKVDFKRKEEPAVRKAEDEETDKNGLNANDGGGLDVVLIMKKCKVLISCDNQRE